MNESPHCGHCGTRLGPDDVGQRCWPCHLAVIAVQNPAAWRTIRMAGIDPSVTLGLIRDAMSRLDDAEVVRRAAAMARLAKRVEDAWVAEHLIREIWRAP
jgi:hypothetical protein